MNLHQPSPTRLPSPLWCQEDVGVGVGVDVDVDVACRVDADSTVGTNGYVHSTLSCFLVSFEFRSALYRVGVPRGVLRLHS